MSATPASMSAARVSAFARSRAEASCDGSAFKGLEGPRGRILFDRICVTYGVVCERSSLQESPYVKALIECEAARAPAPGRSHTILPAGDHRIGRACATGGRDVLPAEDGPSAASR